jgi:maltose O-acetyltransferase
MNVLYNYILVFNFLRRLYLKILHISLGKKSSIHSKVLIYLPGRLKVGDNSVINRDCTLDNRFSITIGNNVSIGHSTKIYSAGHNMDSSYFEMTGKPVLIVDDVCILSNVLIMPGVHIKKGAIILPGTVLTKDVDEYAIIGGNPGKFIRYRNNDLLYKIEYNFHKAL